MKRNYVFFIYNQETKKDCVKFRLTLGEATTLFNKAMNRADLTKIFFDVTKEKGGMEGCETILSSGDANRRAKKYAEEGITINNSKL